MAMAALPGGMRSLTWTQAIQYFVIALACLVPIGLPACKPTATAGAPVIAGLAGVASRKPAGVE